MNTFMSSFLIGIVAGIGAGLAHHFGYKLGYKVGNRDAVMWHKTSNKQPEQDGAYAACWLYQGKKYWDKMAFFQGKWYHSVFAETPLPDYWMAIDYPKDKE